MSVSLKKLILVKPHEIAGHDDLYSALSTVFPFQYYYEPSVREVST